MSLALNPAARQAAAAASALATRWAARAAEGAGQLGHRLISGRTWPPSISASSPSRTS